MKLAVITLLLAPLARAAAHPAAAAAPAAQPLELEARNPNDDKAAVATRVRYAGIILESRDLKTGKKKGGSGSNNKTGNAAGTVSPGRAIQLGALGVGVMEVVRLWG